MLNLQTPRRCKATRGPTAAAVAGGETQGEASEKVAGT